MNKLIVTSTAACLMAVISLPVSVAAHGGATGIVKHRMDGMAKMGSAVKELQSIMQGKQAFDADVIRKNASTIKDHAGTALTDGFPEGSLSKESEAREEIWTDWDRFAALAQRLESLSAGLALAADNDSQMGKTKGAGMGAGMGSMMGNQAMMGSKGMMGQMMRDDHLSAENLANMPAQGVFTMIVQTCAACHTDFRSEKK